MAIACWTPQQVLELARTWRLGKLSQQSDEVDVVLSHLAFSKTIPYRSVHVSIVGSRVIKHEVPDFVFLYRKLPTMLWRAK